MERIPAGISDRKLITVVAVFLILSIGFGGACVGYSRHFGEAWQRESISSLTGSAPADSAPCRDQLCKAARQMLVTPADSQSRRLERGKPQGMDAVRAAETGGSPRVLCNGRLCQDWDETLSFSFATVFLVTCSFLC